MSHTVKVVTQIVDTELIQRTAQVLDAKYLGMGKHKLYAGSYDGVGVHLKGWRYPAVFQADGNVAIDTFNGNWGKEEDLNGFRQRYAVEGALREFRNDPAYHDAVVTETRLENGDISLVATLAGEGETTPCATF
jgi:hypothetical protein